MDTPSTHAAAPNGAFPKSDFLAWLDETTTLALVSASDDRHYAFCLEFGIAGSGSTKDAAISDAKNLLMGYLMASFSEGRSYRDSKKRPPKRIRLQSWYLKVRVKLLRGIKTSPAERGTHVGRGRPALGSRLEGLISVPTTDRDLHHVAH